MKYKVEFFQQREFVCPCCKGGAAAAMLVYALDMFRRAWAAPVRINSGWRCEKHNKEVGGVPVSRHLLGLAADIAPIDASLIGPFQTLAGQIFGRREGWELKLYPRFVHVAVPRGEERTLWSGGHIYVAAK